VNWTRLSFVCSPPTSLRRDSSSRHDWCHWDVDQWSGKRSLARIRWSSYRSSHGHHVSSPCFIHHRHSKPPDASAVHTAGWRLSCWTAIKGSRYVRHVTGLWTPLRLTWSSSGYRQRRDSAIKLTTVMVTPFKLSLLSVPPLRYAPRPTFVSPVPPLVAKNTGFPPSVVTSAAEWCNSVVSLS
jgi:hypothetical protein